MSIHDFDNYQTSLIPQPSILKPLGSFGVQSGTSSTIPDPNNYKTFQDYNKATKKYKDSTPETQAPISLMGELANPKTQNYIKNVSESFGFSQEHIVSLIQRESGGNPRARSPSGSKGIMQLTTSVFTDMHQIGGKGRGIGEYIDNFKKIKPILLETLYEKYPEFVGIIQKIQDLSPKNQADFTTYTRRLQVITGQSTSRGEVELNLLIGSLYLDSIHDRAMQAINNPKNADIMSNIDIIKKLRGVPLNSINLMLTAKQFSPVTQGELQNQVENIINEKEKFGNFLTNYNYNGQKNIDSDKCEHRIKYGLVLCISADQIANQNRL